MIVFLSLSFSYLFFFFFNASRVSKVYPELITIHVYGQILSFALDTLEAKSIENPFSSPRVTGEHIALLGQPSHLTQILGLISFLVSA